MSGVDLSRVAPFATNPDGSALFEAALVVELYLEPPSPEQVPAFEAATAIVNDWIGADLKWTHMSTLGEPDPFDPADLSHVVEHVRSRVPADDSDDPEHLAEAFDRMARGELTVVCHAGEVDWDASATTFRYHVEPIGRPPKTIGASMLRVSVPVATPLADVRARATELASVLPVRWGIAGLGLVGWDVDHFHAMHDAMYPVVRRHPGFDLGLYALQMDVWFERLRTVSWLTFLGPAMRARLAATTPLPARPPAPLAYVELDGGTLLVEAPAPAPGDINRGALPPGYAAVDRLVRPVRCAGRVHFANPWTETTSEEWLRRFEMFRS